MLPAASRIAQREYAPGSVPHVKIGAEVMAGKVGRVRIIGGAGGVVSTLNVRDASALLWPAPVIWVTTKT